MKAPRFGLLAVSLVAVLSVLGCATEQAAAPPVWTAASGDFYDAPKLTGRGRAGEIVRLEKVAQRTNANRTVWRVMYRTFDSQDRPVAATGIVIVPTAPAPAGGWPVLSWGHGTTGMTAKCAPSRMLAMPEPLGFKGVIVGADYPGLGPNGELHAYLSGLSEGRSMIDIVRAARTLGGPAVGKRWIAAGASQGGHAALFAGEVSRREARDLDLLGVLAFAPASELSAGFASSDPELGPAAMAMTLYGRAVDHPKLDPAAYAAPHVAAWSANMSRLCQNDLLASFAALPKQGLAPFKADPRTTEPARSIWLANDPGYRKTGLPILVINGQIDDVITPERTRALIVRECALGEKVEALYVPGANHYDVIVKTPAVVSAWLNARLAGQAAPKTACGAEPSKGP